MNVVPRKPIRGGTCKRPSSGHAPSFLHENLPLLPSSFQQPPRCKCPPSSLDHLDKTCGGGSSCADADLEIASSPPWTNVRCHKCPTIRDNTHSEMNRAPTTKEYSRFYRRLPTLQLATIDTQVLVPCYTAQHRANPHPTPPSRAHAMKRANPYTISKQRSPPQKMLLFLPPPPLLT